MAGADRTADRLRRVAGRWAVVAGLVFVLAACSKDAPAEQPQVARETAATTEITVVARASVLITDEPDEPTPPIERISISPSAVVLDLGEATQLSAEAFGPDGALLSEVEFVWAIGDVRAGTISKEGRFQADTRPGVYDEGISVAAIQNTPDGIRYASASAPVTVLGEVQAPTLASVVFIPHDPTLLEKQIYRMRAVGYDENGMLIPGVSFVWKVNDPALGRINDIGYLTIEGGEGDYPGAVAVTGIWEGARFTSETDVRVVGRPEGGDVLNVHALPQRFFLEPADRLQLRAVALNGLGELVAGTELRWSLQDPAAGTIDGQGNFIAGNTPGVYTQAVKVEAVVPGERGFARAVDFASVVVRAPQTSSSLHLVSAVPETAVLSPGGHATLSGRPVDESGKPAEVVTVSWKVLTEEVGEISPSGAFRASSVPGRYPDAVRVTAEQQLGDQLIVRSNTVNVVITGTMSRVEVRPTLATVAPGRTIHFTVTGWDKNGVVLPGLVTVWSLSDERIGTIDAFGNFTAGEAPGVYENAIQAKVIQRLSEHR